MSGKRRIAIYGGTFDPVHLAHLEIARKVLQLFEVDQFLFVPAWRAPHKIEREVTAPVHRYAMLALATQEEPKILVSTFELEAPDRRYTVDTLEHFRSKFEGSTDLFFVMGGDSWAEIATWRDFERLLTMANHIVVTRPRYDLKQASLEGAFGNRIVDLRGSSSLGPFQNLDSASNKIFLTDAVMMDISASRVRSVARTAQFSDLLKLVPPTVATYISKYQLYRNSNEA
jgi:nicotinate-nucleotide adenylyltransferase